ncbi:EamA family transporter [Heliobacterium gestii]|uniref:EamA family transporter n=1 Tax=Heliomicrobium gestii TaxID=2699 RepID=A0A845LGE8_HELGE|nr:EamA family transporter [Heliomicrobium gestii]MBM7868303.1 drug/metabolite transporter (DMT)-like permease [Heliomicrobium gestii]MZP44494.1 EamA family transporter [Heliomicrobium gestii]
MLGAYALMCAIFGTTFLAIKVGLGAGVQPFFFAGMRFLLAGLAVFAFFRWKAGATLSRQQWQDATYVGVTMTGMLFASLYWGEQYITSGLAALLAATAPLKVSLVEQVQRKGRAGSGNAVFTPAKLFGLVLGLAGVGIAVYPTLQGGTTGTLALIAVIAILLAQGTYAMGAVRSKAALSSGVNPYLFNAAQMIAGGLLLLLLSALFEHGQGQPWNREILGAWVYLTVFGSLIGHGTYYWLVRATNPLFPSTWTYVSPIIAQFVGFWWAGESLTAYTFIGLISVLSGVLLVNWKVLQTLLPSMPARQADTLQRQEQ